MSDISQPNEPNAQNEQEEAAGTSPTPANPELEHLKKPKITDTPPERRRNRLTNSGWFGCPD